MTHAEALERSRRALDARPDCQHELVELGPDLMLSGCTLWGCTHCKVCLAIDPNGVIRDTYPDEDDE